jgi:organic radical activating enzyme
MINKKLELKNEYEVDDYLLVPKYVANTDDIKLRIIHKSAGKHFAEHTKVQILNLSLESIGNENISVSNIKLVIDSIKKKGITEGLFVVKNDNGEYVNQIDFFEKNISPNIVRHKLTNKETSFTSTGEKLDAHWPIFQKYKETGFGSIIRATMTLHQVCSSRCQFCSTIGRNKKDSTTLDEAKDFVNKLYFDQSNYNKKNFISYNQKYKELTGSDIKLRGLILSGGGQPNLWPHFSEFVKWLSDKDISLGLITNGFPKKIDEDIYNNFDWIRISITPEDASSFYPDGKFNLQYIPKNIISNSEITLGLSYVYGPWTNDDILKRINDASKNWNCEYVRVLTDCNLSRDYQIMSHRDLSNKLLSLGFIDSEGNPKTKIFHQLKYHGTKKEADDIWDKGQCYLQTFNTFWDTTGHEENGFSFCYPCDSVTVLAEGNQDEDYNGKNIFSERKFNYNKWGTVRNTEVEKLFTEKVKAYFDPRENCSACLFQRNNKKVKEIIENKKIENIKINHDIRHINFP